MKIALINAGYWKDEKVRRRIGDWMRAAVGAAVSREMKVMRFGDNMREVAVTEGDKVEAQIKLGWQVNTWAVGDLVKEMNAVPETEIDALTAKMQMDKADVLRSKKDEILPLLENEVAVRYYFYPAGPAVSLKYDDQLSECLDNWK